VFNYTVIASCFYLPSSRQAFIYRHPRRFLFTVIPAGFKRGSTFDRFNPFMVSLSNHNFDKQFDRLTTGSGRTASMRQQSSDKKTEAK